MYKLFKNLNGEINSVIRLSDNSFIPMVEDNSDYQAFLLWKSEGNTPLPADSE